KRAKKNSPPECSDSSDSNAFWISGSSTEDLVSVERCLFDLGIDVPCHSLCRRNHAPILDGRCSLPHLRRVSLRASPLPRRSCTEGRGVARCSHSWHFSFGWRQRRSCMGRAVCSFGAHSAPGRNGSPLDPPDGCSSSRWPVATSPRNHWYSRRL